ncbi:MAG: FliM/FliN family flagellar motor switch protein [Anaerovoracaceae bacterium]
MAEILSQNQIDMLLSSLSDPDAEMQETAQQEEKAYKKYDFRSPKHFTREQLRLLSSIYENYARILSSYATGSLQTYCLVEIVGIEEQQYYEFNNALPDSVLMGLVDLSVNDSDRDEDLILMDFSKDISFCAIDRLLGGIGVPLEEDREYSDIELALMDYFMKGMVGLMKNVWFDQVDMSPSLLKIETNSRVIQGVSADENVVIIIMNFRVNETQGKLNICIPAVTMELLFARKAAQSRKGRRSDHQTEEQRKKAIFDELGKSDLEVKMILSNVEVYLQDIMDLEEGDIIKLNKPVGSMIDIVIGNKTWFRGDMGTHNKKIAGIIREPAETKE